MERIEKVMNHQPIQTDFDGIYNVVPEKTQRWHFGSSRQYSEEKQKELLVRAKSGDQEAIDTLKRVYKIKSWIVEGIKVI